MTDDYNVDMSLFLPHDLRMICGEREKQDKLTDKVEGNTWKATRVVQYKDSKPHRL